MVDFKQKDFNYRCLAVVSCKLIGDKKDEFIDSLSDENKIGVNEVLKSMPNEVLLLINRVNYNQLREVFVERNTHKQLVSDHDIDLPDYLDLSKFNKTLTPATEKLITDIVSDLKQEKGKLNE